MSDRLADIKRRKNELRDAIATARQNREQAKAVLLSSGGALDPRSDEFKAAERATQTLDSLKGQIELVEDEERYVLAQVAGISPDLGGESFLSNPETLQTLSRLATSSAPIGSVDLGVGVPREQLLDLMGGPRKMFGAVGPGQVEVGDASRRGAYRGLVPELQRRLRLLDLIPSVPMDAGNLVEFSVEVPSASGDAAETAEGAVKPATEMEFDDADSKVKTIAVHTKVRRQQLADVPTLEAVIRGRLTQRVLRRLETQILSGNGVGDNLLGIYNTTGVGSVEFDADELDADQSLEGIVDVIVSEAEPNGVALHPRNWANMRKQKATEGDGHYFSGGPFLPTNSTLWDVPAIRATGAILDRPLIGDYEIGAVVFVREGVNIRLSDSDQDDFVRNRVTILAEGRFALAVFYPGAFSIVELA